MANYAILKAAIASAIQQNGNNEITGQILQQQLLAMVNSLGGNYQFAGIATPTTNPGTPDQKVFYIASMAGEYPNFDALSLYEGEVAIFAYDGQWQKTHSQIGADIRVVHIVGSGTNAANGGVTGVGQVYYNTNTGVLRRCVSFTSPSVGTYEDVPFSLSAIYIQNGKLYIWNGTELKRITSSYDNIGGSILMGNGVTSGNGNVATLTVASWLDRVGQYYGNGFISFNAIRVDPDDVLEIDYEKMGVDSSIFKIGVLELAENGVWSRGSLHQVNAEPVYYLSDQLVTFNNDTRYIKITLYLRDTTTYALKDDFSIKVNFSKYHSAILEVVKDFVSSANNFSGIYPYVKGITYNVHKTDNVFDIPATLSYQTSEIGFNNGYIIFPKEYSPTGKALPLIIFAHGTDGIQFEDVSNPTYLDLLKNVSAGGYIVADCSTLSSFYYNNDMGTSLDIIDANYAEPMSWECYNKLYENITKRFNVDKDHVYIFGKSAGGLNTLMLSQMNIIPIKAAAGLAGSIDLITDMIIMASAAKNTNPFLHRLGMTDAQVSNRLSGAGDADYLVSHISKLSGFNPLWFKSNNLDKALQIRRCIIDGINTDNIDNDTTLQNMINDAGVSLRIPVKWWQAVDDVNVPIGTTRIYQKMVRNGGGMFEIREFPAGCGAHHAVDNDENAPTITYTHKNGVVVTLPVAYAEVIDWFNLWW